MVGAVGLQARLPVGGDGVVAKHRKRQPLRLAGAEEGGTRGWKVALQLGLPRRHAAQGPVHAGVRVLGGGRRRQTAIGIPIAITLVLSLPLCFEVPVALQFPLPIEVPFSIGLANPFKELRGLRQNSARPGRGRRL